MLAIGKGCGKEIGVATIAEFESFAQLCYGEWEIPDGDIGMGDAGECTAQLLFVHRGHMFYVEDATRETNGDASGNKQMTVGCQGTHPKLV